MINTIFYFADTLAEYLDNWQKGEVKPHTICFAKDTKTIWRNGMRFSGMLQNEVVDEINSIVVPAEERLKAGILRALDAAADVSDDLDRKVAEINKEIATTNQGLLDEHLAMLDKAKELKGRLDRGEVTYNSGWDENVKAYMQNVGMWDYGEDSSIVTKWSQLRLSINGVSSEVAEVRLTEDNHYDTLNTKIDQTASSITSQVDAVKDKADGYNTTLQSKINQEVTARGKAITTLDNKYAKSTKDTLDVIEWLYSGLLSGASADKSYAEIIAAGKNGASQAISNLRTSIENTADGKYVAESSLASKVENNVSGIINRVTGDTAGTSIFSLIGENTKDIAAVNTFIGEHSAQATLAALIGEAKSGAIATVKDDLASLDILSKSSSGYEAGVYTKGEMADAVASFIANDGRNAASVIAQVNKEGSSLSLNADHINIDANHQLDLSALTVTIDADDINLNGQTNFENAIGNWITTKGLKIGDVDGEIKTVIESGNATFSGDVVAKTLTAGPSDGMHIVTTGNEIHFMSGDKVMGKFVTEGNGLQMYIMGPDGDLYKVNFSNWTNTKSGGTSTTYRIYRIQGGGTAGYSVINSVDSVYGNNDDVYYANQQGTVLANIGDSSSTGYYLWPSGGGTTTILSVPNTSHTAIYTVVGYKDVYFVDGVMHDGPNRYLTVTTDNGRTYFINGGSQLSGVYSYSVWLAENANQTCADVTEMDFGSGDAYWATVTNTVTPYTSGKLTRVVEGQYGATLEHYTP